MVSSIRTHTYLLDLQDKRTVMFVAVILLLVGASAVSYSARILAAYPLPLPSHHFVFRPIMEELAKRGHQIVYLTAYPYDEPPKGITQINIQEYYPPKNKDFNFVEFGEYSAFEIVQTMFQLGREDAPFALGNPKVQKLIHSDEKFDAVMFESWFTQEYLSAFVHKFNAIGIETITLGDYCWVNELAGLPDNTAFQLDWKAQMTNDLSFWQRLYNTYITSVVTWSGYYYLNTLSQSIMDEYFNYTGWQDRPSIQVLVKNRSVILANAHPVLGYPFPTAPHYKPIGGVNIKPNKPLPQDIQKFLDESKNGAIYFSFGSMVNVSDPLNAKIINAFLSAFEELSENVLVKYEIKFNGKQPTNVKTSTWMPQQDILAHENVVLFITHGGLLGISEAIYHGVPFIGVPFFGDQAKNLIFAESEGLGKMMRSKDITKETVLKNIRELLSNSTYKTEVMKRSMILRDRRQSPAEEAAYWVEHSLKYPFALTPKAALRLSPLQLHTLDIKLFIMAVLSVFVYCIFFIISRFNRRFLSRASKAKKVKQS